MPKSLTIELTEPQVFWLTVLLESTLSGADPSRGTKSYVSALATLRKAHERWKDTDATIRFR